MKSKYFKIYEWFPKSMCDKYPEDILWGLLGKDLIFLADWFRDRYGRIFINNWNSGGKLSESGFRDFHTTTGAALSAHKFGRAADLHFAAVAPEQVREDIQKIVMPPELTEIEKGTPTWLHIGTRNHNAEGITWLPKP